MTDWNDDKGFGFVVPGGGGDRAFVHIKEFQRSTRRPVAGDLISYEVGKDAQGRLNAKAIRYAGQKIEGPRSHRPIPRLGIALGFFSLVAIATVLGKVPIPLALVYPVISLVSYIMYCLDKAAAEKGYRRTPEATLHLVDLLGGWPGALVAQRQFRHKTVKASFQTTFWVTVVVNLAAVAWLLASGTAHRLSSALVGG